MNTSWNCDYIKYDIYGLGHAKLVVTLIFPRRHQPGGHLLLRCGCLVGPRTNVKSFKEPLH